MKPLRRDNSWLFSLRVQLTSGTVLIDAWERGMNERGSHITLDTELRFNGVTIFRRGAGMTVGIPGNHAIDSDYAKESVLSLYALKPGDTDADFFAGYTPGQLEWVSANGEELSLVALDRYGEP